MSGPKVVRIVTREEILDICNGLLARVDAALADWLRIGNRNACIDDDAIAAAKRRRDSLAALIAADRFTDLQKQAPIEEAFLRDDLQARLAKVAAEQAAARSRQRRQREAAASLLRRLRADGNPIDPALEDRLLRGEADAISEGFRVLAERAAAPSASHELAGRLREGGAPVTFAEWLASRPATSEDPAVARLELRIAELTPLVADAIAEAWRTRLDQAATADPARRGLLLDGLEVETGRALTEARRRAAAAVDLELLLAELDAAGVATTDFRAGTEALDAAALAARTAEARQALDRHRSAVAVAARRQAVLKELCSLGYSVTEGMATTWAEEGRLVLRSATRPDYGVEVTAAGGGERMQMRAVAFDAGDRGPDPARDCDAEAIWCGDVAALQDRLGAIGGGLVIEKSLPVGATPLKRIAIAGDRYAASEAPTLRERTRR